MLTNVAPAQYFGADVPPQTSFQPCASEKEKSKRYLAFNDIGFIILRDEHSQNSLEVEFHDTARHRPIKLVDRNSVTMGALGNSIHTNVSHIEGTNGFALASNIQKEMPSVVLYKGIDNSFSWTYTLPEGEDTDGTFRY